MQDVLWKLLPSLSKHHPGMLNLLIRMLVILKLNEATELRATNGAKDVVVGWDLHMDAMGQEFLETLFM